MSTYAQIRTRVIQRLSEYHGGVAESASAASFSGQTIYDRIISCYRDMVGEVAEKDPEKVVTTTAMTYTAGAESTTLPAAAQYTRILAIERLVGSSYEPMRRGTYSEERAMRLADVLELDYQWRVERTALLIYPTPPDSLTLRIRHVARIAEILDSTNDADSPDLIPEEFHHLLAMRTAASFKAEVGEIPFENELAYANERWLRWAAAGDNGGPRMVRMVTDY